MYCKKIKKEIKDLLDLNIQNTKLQKIDICEISALCNECIFNNKISMNMFPSK